MRWRVYVALFNGFIFYKWGALLIFFQSTHEERQGAGASAEQGKRIAKSPLQRTLSAQIMGRWTKHNRALEYIGVTRSLEMMELQRAQYFPACPTNPDTSVFRVLSCPSARSLLT